MLDENRKRWSPTISLALILILSLSLWRGAAARSLGRAAAAPHAPPLATHRYKALLILLRIVVGYQIVVYVFYFLVLWVYAANSPHLRDRHGAPSPAPSTGPEEAFAFDVGGNGGGGDDSGSANTDNALGGAPAGCETRLVPSPPRARTHDLPGASLGRVVRRPHRSLRRADRSLRPP